MSIKTVNIPDSLLQSLMLSNDFDFSSYLIQLIREDLLLKEINESKSTGINILNNLDDLDN